MTLPQDLNLIRQLLTEKKLDNVDLDTVTNPGFYFCTDPSHDPNSNGDWCHLIVTSPGTLSGNLTRIMQIYLSDHYDDANCYLWYRQNNNGTWTTWKKVARDDGQTYSTMPQVTAEVTRILTTAEF
jgi:hypothetical protein